MTTELSNNQYELVDLETGRSLVFGRGTPYTVQTREDSEPEINASDAAVEVGDGIRFGRDYVNGRTITFEMNLLTPHTAGSPEALAKLEDIASMWRNDWVRRKAGQLCELRYRIANRTRKVYGRPRKFVTTSGRTHQGWIPITCDFQCIDDKYYDDQPFVETIVMSNPGVNGLEMPFEHPFTFGTHGETRPSVINVEGSVAAVPVFTIYGPILNPEIQQVGGWTIKFSDLNLLFNEYMIIDPRHWKRTIMRGGFSLAGKMDATSPAMSDMWLEPGEHQIVLRGIDPTARARLGVEAHFAHASY